VHFDEEKKISQIRLYWDQGSLLKQLDVIGSHHRNWPIRDSSEQTRLIRTTTSSVTESSAKPVPEPRRPDTATSTTTTATMASVSTGKKQFKDPHATLSLFESLNMDDGTQAAKSGGSNGRSAHRHNASRILGGGGDEIEEEMPPPPKTTSTKYRHFEFGEADAPAPTPKPALKSHSHFEFGEADAPMSPERPTPTRAPKSRGHFEFGEADVPTFSPVKATPAKVRGHFEFGDDEPPAPSPMKATPAKVVRGHFEFGDGEEHQAPAPQPKKKTEHFEIGDELDSEGPQQAAKRAVRSTKGMSQWGFEDFALPEEPKAQKARSKDARSLGWSDDENDVVQSAVKPKPDRAHNPRRDAESHFTIQDEEGSPTGEEKKPVRLIGGAHNKGLRLYENNLYDESGDPPPEAETKSTLSTAPNGTGRKKDFDAHWVMTDDPIPEEPVDKKEENKNKQPPSNQTKAMKSNWDIYGDEDVAAQQPAARPVAGKRLGKNANERHWGFGDE
jgi:hypothetical protein